MPPLPPEASSLVAHDKPAPPRSWMPTTRSSAKISSEHSIKTFSTNGSPTCTAGRFAGPVDSKVSDAKTETPPIPSPPVFAPYRTTRFPAPAAFANLMSLCFITPTQRAFTSGLPKYVSSKTTSPPILARPRQFPYPPTPAITPGKTRRVSAASAGPNRSGSITAMGRAPIVKISRTIPPIPVAAP